MVHCPTRAAVCKVPPDDALPEAPTRGHGDKWYTRVVKDGQTYATNAGAVMLTDCVFWFIIFPFLTVKDYNLNFLLIGMHSVNAVFLLGEAALNSLRFPWFRIAYFFLWTALYVIFQWILHASFPLWWPYPFLDVSANLSPVWYFAVAVTVLCNFQIGDKLKHHLLIKWFPGSVVRGSSTP